MKVTASKLIDLAGLAAVAAGLLFVIIQAIHPADALASVTTSAWAIVHLVSLTMLILFAIGVAGIYARQVEAIGWLGLIGLAVLSLALLLTAAGDILEVLVLPQLAGSNPDYVEGFLAMVEGQPIETDLGGLPTFWAVSGACFLIGTVTFGIANLRAGQLPRVASALFAFGLFLSGPVVAVVGTPRLAAVPIGLGLAWMGYAHWSGRRTRSARPVLGGATPKVEQTVAA